MRDQGETEWQWQEYIANGFLDRIALRFVEASGGSGLR
jgi:hypothetical protein